MLVVVVERRRKMELVPMLDDEEARMCLSHSMKE